MSNCFNKKQGFLHFSDRRPVGIDPANKTVNDTYWRSIMQTNMGVADRVIRGLVAVLIGVFYLLGLLQGTTALVLGVLATVFLVTGIVGFCPLYVPLGLTTCKRA
jgi:hypothetical protein